MAAVRRPETLAPQLGVISLRFMYSRDEILDALLRVDFGAGTQAMFGIRFWVW